MKLSLRTLMAALFLFTALGYASGPNTMHDTRGRTTKPTAKRPVAEPVVTIGKITKKSGDIEVSGKKMSESTLLVALDSWYGAELKSKSLSSKAWNEEKTVTDGTVLNLKRKLGVVLQQEDTKQFADSIELGVSETGKVLVNFLNTDPKKFFIYEPGPIEKYR